MTGTAKLLAGTGGLVLFLAACGGGGNGEVQDQFGAFFAAAFEQDPNDVPKDDPELVIDYQGANGVDPTAGPIDI